MADVTFIVHSDWLENIQDLSVEQQDKVIADIVRYGTGKQLMHDDDPMIRSLVNMVKGSIDYSKDKYAAKAQSPGRKKAVNEEAITELVKQGKKSAEIAEILGISKSSVDHSEAWKNRFVYQF